MRKKILFIVMFICAMLTFQSCNKEKVGGFVTGNPMPGSWYAKSVEYDGMLVDFNVDINSDFKEGEGVYGAEGQVGRMVVTCEGAPVMSADIRNCIYNSSTYTGRFVIHYDDDEDPEYVFSMDYYYDWVKDRFTVISISYNITFCRR